MLKCVRFDSLNIVVWQKQKCQFSGIFQMFVCYVFDVMIGHFKLKYIGKLIEYVRGYFIGRQDFVNGQSKIVVVVAIWLRPWDVCVIAGLTVFGIPNCGGVCRSAFHILLR